MVTRITVNNIRQNYFIIFIALLVWGVVVFGVSVVSAAPPPRPQSKVQALGALDLELTEKQQTQDILRLEVHELEAELSSTRKKLISKARAVQDSELVLKKLEDRIVTLERDKVHTEDSINKDRRSIGKLVIALERLRRLPPEVIIARPDAPINTARSSMLIGEIVPVLTARAARLRDQVAVLQATRAELEQKRLVASARSVRLNEQYTKMTSLMSAREQLYKRTRGDYKAYENKVNRIAKQSRNLKDLVVKLDEDKARAQTRKLSARAVAKMGWQQKPPKRLIPAQGSSQLPVSGMILVQYGAPDRFGGKSKGVKIEGRSGALVVAPMGGVVRFAGDFKNYGNLIIIEHKKGYHSLVAGLKKIDTVVGQNITAGEPIGVLARAKRGKSPVLYYELRFKGNAINPAKKFAELS